MLASGRNLTKISAEIGYHFKNQSLLLQALTRKSGIIEGKQEKHIGHNERLEFFGDGIFRAIVDDILMELHPDWQEDKLSQQRDLFVDKNGLLIIFAEKINLENFIVMGSGERNNFSGSGRNKILADTMEAVIGAIFIDNDKNYLNLKKIIIKNCDLQKGYDEALITAIIRDDLNQVKSLLKAGANPNTTGDTHVFKYSLGKSESNAIVIPDNVWGRDSVTLFYGEFTQATALELTLMQHLIVPEVTFKPMPPSPGRMAVVKEGVIHYEPLQLKLSNPTLQDIFTAMAPIDLKTTWVGQSLTLNLTLAPHQPGYNVVWNFFENNTSPNCLEILKCLLEHGANPNQAKPGQGTALHTAVYVKNEKAIKLLLQSGVNPDLKDARGNTAVSDAKSTRVALLFSEHQEAHKNWLIGYMK